MKNKYLIVLLITVALCSLNACKDNDDDKDPELSDNEYTNKWINNQMKRLYLWNNQLPTAPNYKQEPEDFFYGILYQYKTITGDRFSWIEEDETKTKTTRTLFGGKSLGFDYIPNNYFDSESSKTSSLGFFVTSVDSNSDAANKGLKRGNVICEIDGMKPTVENYEDILHSKTSFSLLIYDELGTKKTLKDIRATSPKKSPVFLSKVIEASGKKIGYLMYNEFTRNANDVDNNYEYDLELMDSIRSLNNQNISDFILDLRYNPGGYLTSAMNLASALVPNRDITKIFAKERYNKHFEDSIVKHSGANALNEYFLDKAFQTGTDIPRTNFSRLYVIATNYSASASELVIHGLRAHMTVYHVGETTVGKDKGSIPIKSSDKRILWKLQPLVSRLTDANGNGNYINGLKPNYEISEWNEAYNMIDAYYTDDNENRVDVKVPILSNWKGGFGELGNLSEPLLAETIAQITGIPRAKQFVSDIPPTKSGREVPYVKRNQSRYRTIIEPKN